jgi:hypothetical protein
MIFYLSVLTIRIFIDMSDKYIPYQLGIIDNIESSTLASYLNILLKVEPEDKLTSQFYDIYRNDFNVPIVNFPCM